MNYPSVVGGWEQQRYLEIGVLLIDDGAVLPVSGLVCLLAHSLYPVIPQPTDAQFLGRYPRMAGFGFQ